MRGTFWGLVLGSAGGLVGCASRPRSVGLSLQFQNHGPNGILVTRAAFDGHPGSGHVPGVVGVSRTGGANLSFMPGDRSGGPPQFVDIEWMEYSIKFDQWSKRQQTLSRQEQNSAQSKAEFAELWAQNPRFSQRVDLTPIITPELVAKVMADPKGTHLKLTIVFKDGQVSIRAEADRWLDEEAVRFLEQVYPERKGTFR